MLVLIVYIIALGYYCVTVDSIDNTPGYYCVCSDNVDNTPGFYCVSVDSIDIRLATTALVLIV